MLPPACAPKSPESLALSLKLSPTVPEAGSWVVAIAGWAWAISTGSSAQPLVASLLLASPEDRETQRQNPACEQLAHAGFCLSPSTSPITGPSEPGRPPSQA